MQGKWAVAGGRNGGGRWEAALPGLLRAGPAGAQDVGIGARRHHHALVADAVAYAACAGYLAYRVSIGVGQRIIVGSDSHDYLAAARVPFWSKTVWFGPRPPLEGLFIRLVGHDLGHIVWSQTVAGAVCAGSPSRSRCAASWGIGCSRSLPPAQCSYSVSR